ncbi:hypothetical protein MMH89_00680 [Candidatus Comchoanobacter bicostacola]|uniref:Uncharacterized protein n=1 Tax=Candidatus Comchoanobacter bicostacola TaxID=2919598 RepID=A0ABY5DM97_9GAMM|nr:hypothetical protein [Candidatus Comchoanobacter bicostacola]UTC24679.1 hypothetical protein MMH89_00680 [Candidatus Comchoanobacter bicostacola]
MSETKRFFELLVYYYTADKSQFIDFIGDYLEVESELNMDSELIIDYGDRVKKLGLLFFKSHPDLRNQCVARWLVHLNNEDMTIFIAQIKQLMSKIDPNILIHLCSEPSLFLSPQDLYAQYEPLIPLFDCAESLLCWKAVLDYPPVEEKLAYILHRVGAQLIFINSTWVRISAIKEQVISYLEACINNPFIPDAVVSRAVRLMRLIGHDVASKYFTALLGRCVRHHKNYEIVEAQEMWSLLSDDCMEVAFNYNQCMDMIHLFLRADLVIDNRLQKQIYAQCMVVDSSISEKIDMLKLVSEISSVASARCLQSLFVNIPKKLKLADVYRLDSIVSNNQETLSDIETHYQIIDLPSSSAEITDCLKVWYLCSPDLLCVNHLLAAKEELLLLNVSDLVSVFKGLKKHVLELQLRDDVAEVLEFCIAKINGNFHMTHWLFFFNLMSEFNYFTKERVTRVYAYLAYDLKSYQIQRTRQIPTLSNIFYSLSLSGFRVDQSEHLDHPKMRLWRQMVFAHRGWQEAHLKEFCAKLGQFEKLLVKLINDKDGVASMASGYDLSSRQGLDESRIDESTPLIVRGNIQTSNESVDDLQGYTEFHVNYINSQFDILKQDYVLPVLVQLLGQVGQPLKMRKKSKCRCFGGRKLGKKFLHHIMVVYHMIEFKIEASGTDLNSGFWMRSTADYRPRKRALAVVRSKHIKAAQLLAPVLGELEGELYRVAIKADLEKRPGGEVYDFCF